MMFIYLVLACLLVTGTAAVGISEKCLNCICKVEGCESEIGKCRFDAGSLRCGPFHIDEPYWAYCGRPGGGFRACTTQMACSRTCVQTYMTRRAILCTEGLRAPTCQDFARLHDGGIRGCKDPSTLDYWKKVEQCCGCGCCVDS